LNTYEILDLESKKVNRFYVKNALIVSPLSIIRQWMEDFGEIQVYRWYVHPSVDRKPTA